MAPTRTPDSTPDQVHDDRPTVWVLGDQLNRSSGALRGRGAAECRVLLVESTSKLGSKPWHVQRLHMIVSAMAHFAEELRSEGFEVDYRIAPTMSAGLRAHCDEFQVERVLAAEPASWNAHRLLGRLGVELVTSDHFLCHRDDFAEWVAPRRSFKLEDFYRWQRERLDVLMEPDGPAGGRWNFDSDNREPPPRDGRAWPEATLFELDEIDEEVLARLPPTWGAAPSGVWPVTRDQALVRLDEFITDGLVGFGPHQDAMLGSEWKLSHSILAASLNIGLLSPAEVIAEAEAAYRSGAAPLGSVEGFIRQVIGWREYVWGLYWHWMPEYRDENQLGATEPVPPAFTGTPTQMECVSDVVGHVYDHGYAHHIERLMVLGNLALTSGVDPWQMTEWMWAGFVDGAEWVMLPNVIGMALHADGGRMATKPYASGGAYLHRMGDACKRCTFNPKHRVGPTACPFTTLYWDFIARHETTFAGNHRMSRQVAMMRRLSNLDEVRAHAVDIRSALAEGTL